MFIKKLLILSIALMVSHTAEAKKIYKILGDAPNGSNFRPVEATSPVPFTKKYQQFTPEQQQIYRSYFEYLGADDIPPFPKGRLRSLYKPLIKGHERIARGGYLRLIAKINEKGGVDEVAVYESPSEKMTELAIAVFFNTKFQPASCSGEPCKMEFPFEFKLRDRVPTITSLNKEDFGGNNSR